MENEWVIERVDVIVEKLNSIIEKDYVKKRRAITSKIYQIMERFESDDAREILRYILDWIHVSATHHLKLFPIASYPSAIDRGNLIENDTKSRFCDTEGCLYPETVNWKEVEQQFWIEDGLIHFDVYEFLVYTSSVDVSMYIENNMKDLQICSVDVCKKLSANWDYSSQVTEFINNDSYTLAVWNNMYLLFATTDNNVVHQIVLKLRYIDYAMKVETSDDPEWTEYEIVYEWTLERECKESFGNDHELVQKCLKEKKEDITLSKEQACGMQEGYHNSILEFNWQDGYAKTFWWLKKDGKLHYVIEASAEEYISCEESSYQLFVYEYDCSNGKAKEIHHFKDQGVRICWLDVMEVYGETMLYRVWAYEYYWCRAPELYALADKNTQWLEYITFLLVPGDENSDGKTNKLNEETYKKILSDIQTINRQHVYIGWDGLCSWNHGQSFSIISWFGNTTTLRYTFDIQGEKQLIRDYQLRRDNELQERNLVM